MAIKSKASRFLLVLLSLILSFSLFACSETKYPAADETIKGFFEALNKSDFKTAESYWAIDNTGVFEFYDENVEKISKLMYSRTKYEILSSREEDGKTIVKVKLTNVDLSKIIESMTGDLIAQAMDSALKGEDTTNKGEEIGMKYLEDSMTKPDVPVITKEIEITLSKDKKRKQWIIQNDDVFIKNVLGSADDLF